MSIFYAYFEAGLMKNLSIFEPQIEKHYAYKKKMYHNTLIQYRVLRENKFIEAY